MTNHNKQNAFVFYLGVLAYMVAAVVLRAVALAPLACLFVFDGALRLLALLCPVLMIFGILPLRYSFAQAMAAKPRRFNLCKAFSLKDYGKKLKAALLHVLSVMKWAIPLFAMGIGVVYCFKNLEYLDMYEWVKELGNNTAMMLVTASEWLAERIGTPVYTAVNNNIMLGAAPLGMVVLLGVLVLMIGVMRNSASRYIWAAATDSGKAPRQEIKKQLKGRRMRQLGVAIVNLILWAPFLCVVGSVLKSTFSDMSTVMMLAIATRSLPSNMLMEAITPAAIAFGALYLPLLPLRRILVAAYALGTPKKSKADRKAAA